MPTPYLAQIPRLVENLRNVYARRTVSDVEQGVIWYDNAHAIAQGFARRYRYALVTVANAIAAISPQCRWEDNVRIAHEVIRGIPSPAVSHGALPANVRKAQSMLRDRFTGRLIERMPFGYKVECFAQNIIGNLEPVTVDTHAIQAAHDDVGVTMTLKKARYAAFMTAYVLASQHTEFKPAVFQAIVWHTWKREHPTREKIQQRTQWEPLQEV